MVSDLIMSGTYLWDVDLISEIFDPIDVRKFLRSALPPIGTPDKLTWHYEKSGSYTVKSVYALTANLISEYDRPDPGWNKLWSLKLPPK